MAIMAVVVLGPSTTTITRARIKPGIDCTASMKRWTMRSTVPPAYALTVPTMTPTPVASRTDKHPTQSEMRDPYRIRLRISRPRLSVPRGWVQLGGWRRSASATVSGSYGASTPAPAALRMSARRITADTIPSGLRLASRSQWESQRAPSLCRWRRVSLATRGGPKGDLLIPDSGVKPRIGNVHQQIHDDQDYGEEQDVGLYLRIVAKPNRGEHQKANAWEGKERLQN